MAHFLMSTGGSKSNEHVAHFLIDIHNDTKLYFVGMHIFSVFRYYESCDIDAGFGRGYNIITEKCN